jgi:hypothetical protein
MNMSTLDYIYILTILPHLGMVVKQLTLFIEDYSREKPFIIKLTIKFCHTNSAVNRQQVPH